MNIQSVVFVSNVRTITRLHQNHLSTYLCQFLFVRFVRFSTEFLFRFSCIL